MRAFVPGSDFDSRLSGNTLTITVKVLLVPTEAGVPRDVRRDGKMVNTVAWPSAHWDAWPGQFKTAVQDAWHNQFELRCASEHLADGVTHRIACHLELLVSGLDEDYEGPPHCRAEVDYFSDTAFAVSSAYLEGNRLGPGETDMFLDYGDVLPAVKSGGNVQHGVIHEFGHYLGLHHRCTGISKGYCRGVTGVDTADIMASGDTHRPWHAEPWLRRLAGHDFHPTENWWAVVVGDTERSGEVQPSDSLTSLGRQNAMKSTAGMNQADIDALLVPVDAGREPAQGLLDSVNTGLGLPLTR